MYPLTNRALSERAGGRTSPSSHDVHKIPQKYEIVNEILLILCDLHHMNLCHFQVRLGQYDIRDQGNILVLQPALR